jgi:hypothetical protein
LGPLELEVVVEAVLAFLDVLPQLLHPSHLHLDRLDDLLAAGGFAFLELEHFLIVDELSQSFLLVLDDFLELSDAGEAALDASVVEVEGFTLETGLNFLEMFFKLFDSVLGLASFNGLGAIDFLFDFGGNEGDGLVVVHQLHALLHLVLLLLFVSFLEGLEHFLDSVQSEIDVVSALVQSLQAVHHFQQVLYVFVDRLVSGVDVLL